MLGLRLAGALMLLFCGAGRCASQTIEVDTAVFMRQARELQEIIVNPHNEKYSKKNNPAVELIRRIREGKDKGDPRLMSEYSYDSYSKSTLGLLDIADDLLKKYPFLDSYIETDNKGHREVLDVILREKATTREYSGSKSATEVVRGERSTGVGTSVDAGGADVILDDLLREIDIYENDIALMGNRFPSPLSAIGDDFYKYYITDTLDIEGTRCIQITFTPRNPESHSFMGNLYAALGDTTGFIKKIEMKIPRTINLNYVDNLYIDQTFEQDPLGKRHKITDNLELDLCLIPGTQRFYAKRTTASDHFAYSPPATPFETEDSFDPAFRLIPLNEAEMQMGSFMASLREIPFFYWGEKILVILVGGYVKTGNPSLFDIGPVNTLISYNDLEGVRLRAGGMTTTSLSRHLFASGYLAYGFKDRRWKYSAEMEYSFIPKEKQPHEYPVNSIRGLYRNDVDMIGQHYLFTNADNVFLSWKRKPANLSTYRKQARLEYKLELKHDLSFSVWGEHTQQSATRQLTFTDGWGRNYSSYSKAVIGANVRFAPGEKYIQRRKERISVNLDAPVFILSQEWGPKGLIGSDFALCKTEMSAYKRFWFSAFGSLDMILRGGIIWSQVQYPDLLWPNANLSYTIQPESFSLLNPMEFAIDKYAQLDLTYWGNGILFNRIPYVKKAKLREVIGFKGLAGGLSKRNNPAIHKNLFQFPIDSQTRLMGRAPYMEISAGIDNIFTILRIDYVWRLTYRSAPGADRSGLRVALHFNF